MFERDFYVNFVNAEIAKEMKEQIPVGKLNAKEPRTLRAIEATGQQPAQISPVRPLTAR